MGKKQVSFLFILSLTAVLWLGACVHMPGQTRQYEPVTYDAARIAAPYGGAMSRAISCRVSKGTAKFISGWKNFETTDFILPTGRTINVELMPTRSDDSMEFQGYYDMNGQKMMFCPVIDAPPGKKIACASLYVMEDDLDFGIKRTFDIPRAVQGGSLSCAFDAEKVKK